MSQKLLQVSNNSSPKSSLLTTSRSNSSENIDFFQQRTNDESINKRFNIRKIQQQNIPLFRFISATGSEKMDAENTSQQTQLQQEQDIKQEKTDSRFEVAKVDEIQPLIKKSDKTQETRFSSNTVNYYDNDDDDAHEDQVTKKCYTVNYDSKEKISSITFNCGSKLIASYVSCCDDFKNITFYKKLLAEYLGTMILVIYACSIGLPITEIDGVPSINGCLGGGLTLATLVWCFGSISGAHLNPAVSIAFLFTGKINPLVASFYIGSQLFGALSGAFVLDAIVPDFAKGTLSVTQLSSELTLAQGFGVEFIITFILVLTVYACVDKHRKDLNGSFPLQIGFAVVVGGLFGGPFTGGSMNPARSFGPAVVTGNWKNHWIYWIGPISGAIFAGFLYKFVLTAQYLEKTQKKAKTSKSSV